jgi:hypothetical protein
LFFVHAGKGQVDPYYVDGANIIEQSIDRAREALGRWKPEDRAPIGSK